MHTPCISDGGQQEWRVSVTADGYLGCAAILINCIKRWLVNERHWRQDSGISSHCHDNDIHIFLIQHTQTQHCAINGNAISQPAAIRIWNDNYKSSLRKYVSKSLNDFSFSRGEGVWEAIKVCVAVGKEPALLFNPHIEYFFIHAHKNIHKFRSTRS